MQKGKVFVVGIGPGGKKHMSIKALEALRHSEVVIGYKTYLDLVEDIVAGKKKFKMEMREEAKRAALAVEEAKKGNNVALVSGGDPGIYAMASVLFGYLRKIGEDVDVEIIPGITAAIAAAACLGAPLGHDFAVISLSDILTSWDVIERRIKEAAKGDFVVVFYNPKSKQRKWQIGRAKEILMKYRDPNTPVGLVKNAMRKGEEKILTTLEKMERHPIDMSTTVIVGNSKTFVYRDKMITPRE